MAPWLILGTSFQLPNFEFSQYVVDYAEGHKTSIQILATTLRTKIISSAGATIAQKFCLRLPSCSSPEHTIYALIIYSQILLYLSCIVKKQKDAGFGPLKKDYSIVPKHGSRRLVGRKKLFRRLYRKTFYAESVKISLS